MKILQSIDIFPVLLTLAAFRVGQLCQQKWKKPVFNPTLIAAILVIAFLLITGFETKVYNAGMGKLSWLMTPATISLAIPMYEQFQVLKKSLKAIAAGVAAGTISCMLVVFGAGALLRFEDALLLSLLPKSVTTAIGVSLSELFGGMGGVSTAEDVIEMMLAGATAVEVGAANLVNPFVCRDMIRDLPEVMAKYKIENLSEIIGGAQ